MLARLPNRDAGHGVEVIIIGCQMGEAKIFYRRNCGRVVSEQMMLHGNVRSASQHIYCDRLDVQAESMHYIQHILMSGQAGEQVRMLGQARRQAFGRQVMHSLSFGEHIL